MDGRLARPDGYLWHNIPATVRLILEPKRRSSLYHPLQPFARRKYWRNGWWRTPWTICRNNRKGELQVLTTPGLVRKWGYALDGEKLFRQHTSIMAWSVAHNSNWLGLARKRMEKRSIGAVVSLLMILAHVLWRQEDGAYTFRLVKES